MPGTASVSYGGAVVVLGADVDELERLARRMRAAGSSLAHVESSTTTSVRAAFWIGPDADTFRSRWSSVTAPHLRRIIAAVEEQAVRLDGQAREQRAASAGEPVGGGPGGPAPTPTPVPERAPLPAHRVVRTEIYRANGQLGIGPLQVQLQGQYRIEHLANGMIRVTELGTQKVGAGFDAGARVEIDAGEHEFRTGAMAGIAGLAGVQNGRTWEIPSDQLDELIISTNLDRIDPSGAGRRAVSAGNRGLDELIPDDLGSFDEASQQYRHYLDYRTPPPERQGVDVVASAEAYALVGATGSADARAAGGIEMGGFVERDGDVGVRFQVEGTASAGVDVPALSIPGVIDPPSVGAQYMQGHEIVFDPSGQPKQFVVERVSGSADHPRMEQVTVDIVTDQQREDVQIIRDYSVDPSPQNAARLQQIDPAEWAPYTQKVTADLRVGGEDYGAGAGAGAIPGLVEGSADLKLERQTIEYDYPNPAL